MTVLGTLKLVAAKPRNTQITPALHRRHKVCTKLDEQLAMAKAFAAGNAYRATKQKKVLDAATGTKRTVEVEKRVKQWWWAADNGRVCLSVRYGAKLVELAKGKTACEVANGDELIAAIETIREAVNTGELDTQIEAAAGAVRAGFKK